MSYMSNALIRPVVAYLNTNYTEIPLKCTFDMKLSDFNGAWYPYDAKVWAYLSESSGREIAKKVEV
jgi:distribution and morphology protein 31